MCPIFEKPRFGNLQTNHVVKYFHIARPILPRDAFTEEQEIEFFGRTKESPQR